MTYDYADLETGANATHFGTTLFIYGTWGGTDVKQDLNFVPKIAYGACGHRGAYEQAEWLSNNVDWSKVTDIAGHSLGADVMLWLGIMKPELSVKGYGPFPCFYWFPKNHASCVWYIYGWDAVARFLKLLWPFRRNYGKCIHIPGKGFHPCTDHLRYQALKKFGIKVEEEL